MLKLLLFTFTWRTPFMLSNLAKRPLPGESTDNGRSMAPLSRFYMPRNRVSATDPYTCFFDFPRSNARPPPGQGTNADSSRRRYTGLARRAFAHGRSAPEDDPVLRGARARHRAQRPLA